MTEKHDQQYVYWTGSLETKDFSTETETQQIVVFFFVHLSLSLVAMVPDNNLSVLLTIDTYMANKP